MKTAISFLLPLFLASSVYAHGHVANVTIGGETFKGAFPFGDGTPSTEGVVRNVKDNSPVHFSDTGGALTCGLMASAVKDVAVGKAGEVMQFAWNDGGNWIHDTGPLLSYMCRCTNGDCTTFDTSTAKWFKIDEQARVHTGARVNVTIPRTLKAGPYIVRHEIIALHLASKNNVDGVEFYPSCLQLNVTGDGTDEPADDDLVAFPGGYTDDDPGLLVDPYGLKSQSSYKFPGPALAALVETSSGAGKARRPRRTPRQVHPHRVLSRLLGTRRCPLRHPQPSIHRQIGESSMKKRSGERYRPRHYSRMMRGLGFKGLR
ncbi:hypothetical protein BDZ89DRAFT_1056390 [Hymenopellis radicata]|nr:hypothetical protein BDZ89DRAFT_1056390 [Hymenopellis radicata]